VSNANYALQVIYYIFKLYFLCWIELF
jgi:hypothetical protein